MRQHMISTWKTNIATFVSSLLLVLVAGSMLMPASAQAQDYLDYDYSSYYSWQILGYDVEMTVEEDGVIDVVETISVDFSVYKHGIYRYIPTLYALDWGLREKIDLDIISISRNGVEEPYRSFREGAARVWQIGDADVTITGKQVYEIHYTVEDVLLFDEIGARLYWNATGDDWEVPVRNVTVLVHLPQANEVLETACYTGAYGSTEDACGVIVSGNDISIAANEPLTIDIGFTRGNLQEITGFALFTKRVMDNWHIAIGPALLLAAFILWWRFGRDLGPRRTVIAEYEPPEGISPPYAGALMRGFVRKEDITGMLVHLAVLGYLKIEVEEKRGPDVIRFHRVKDADDQLDAQYTDLYEGIFGKKNEDKVTLGEVRKRMTTARLARIRKGIYSTLEDRGWLAKHSMTWRGVMMAWGVGMMPLGILLGTINPFAGSLCMLCAPAVIWMGWFMIKLHPEGREMQRRVRGFREFMHTAERYRSEWQEKKEIFAAFLPYAIVFKDVKRWAKAFKDLAVDQPDWVMGNWAAWNVMQFSKGMQSWTNQINSSVATSPSSSGGAGSVGGGFSGGGFGGGGGGSW